MPRKPFEYMIVSLNKDYHPTNFKSGDVVIVTPYNWYGNTNGWSKDDPGAYMYEQKEKEELALDPYLAQEIRTYWNQERGFVLESYGRPCDFGVIVSRDENYWDILNIDGVDQSKSDLPIGAVETLQQYLSTSKIEKE